MLRIVLIILLLLSSVAVMAHGVLVYRLAVAATLIAEEEGTDQKPAEKEAKEINGEQTALAGNWPGQGRQTVAFKALLGKTLCFSKGFYDKPYNPPDHE